MRKRKISVVLPCLNESKNLPLLLPEIIKNIPQVYDYEIICVDDGSTDNTAGEIIKLGAKDKKIKGIILYRRFGHQTALRVGIKKCSGDAVITMDADFQHPPGLLGAMLRRWEKGHDLVQAQKKEDKTASLSRKLERRIGYWVWDRITNGIIKPGISDFRLMSRAIADYVSLSEERELFLRGLVSLGARNPTIITYEVGKRRYGKSSYSTGVFIEMFINGFVSFSTKPLRIASVFGLILTFVTGAFLIYDTLSAILTGRKIIEGFVTIVLLVLILNGFIIFYLGILGEYLGVVFREVKKRPPFLISETINL